jgi:HepT-like protein
MSDTRWTDVEVDLENAAVQLGMAVRTFGRGGFDSEDADAAWERSNAFLHGMETGYTLIESAIKRILGILGESLPTGDSWHADLIERASRAISGANGRPAIFDAGLRRDLLELMRMRHRARNLIYDEFDAAKAGSSVEAANRVLARIMNAIEDFKKMVDPEPSDDNEGGTAPPPI